MCIRDRDWTDEFWSQTILAAFRLRAAIGLTDDPKTDAYRLVHGEGDGLPGLIIDLYGVHAVIQCHTMGMYQVREKIAEALVSVFEGKLKTIYNKSKESLGQQSSVIENEFFLGETQETLIIEHSYRFKVNWVTGQKTGFFLDQRANRKIVSELCHGKSVLNLFSYSGGFSIYALESGAIEVVSVDVSAKAIELTEDNVALIRNTGVTPVSYTHLTLPTSDLV